MHAKNCCLALPKETSLVSITELNNETEDAMISDTTTSSDTQADNIIMKELPAKKSIIPKDVNEVRRSKRTAELTAGYRMKMQRTKEKKRFRTKPRRKKSKSAKDPMQEFEAEVIDTQALLL
jgi:hypothetical protein